MVLRLSEQQEGDELLEAFGDDDDFVEGEFDGVDGQEPLGIWIILLEGLLNLVSMLFELLHQLLHVFPLDGAVIRVVLEYARPHTVSQLGGHHLFTALEELLSQLLAAVHPYFVEQIKKLLLLHHLISEVLLNIVIRHPVSL